METAYTRKKEFKKFMGRTLYSWDVEKMAETLDKRGFFTAPASTKFHGNYEGGLYDHSLAVARNLIRLTDVLDLKWKRDSSPYIVGMLHDLCKLDRYVYKDGEYKIAAGQLMDGHGSLSAILAQQICDFQLTNEEILCIRWHMGAFDDKENWKYYTQSIEAYPNVLYTHTADMMASRIEGV